MAAPRVPRGAHRLTVLVGSGAYRVQGAARVELAWGAVTVHGEAEVVVDGLPVAGPGDSYASGEGNPEVRRQDDGDPVLWGDGGDTAPPGRTTEGEPHPTSHLGLLAARPPRLPVPQPAVGEWEGARLPGHLAAHRGAVLGPPGSCGPAATAGALHPNEIGPATIARMVVAAFGD